MLQSRGAGIDGAQAGTSGHGDHSLMRLVSRSTRGFWSMGALELRSGIVGLKGLGDYAITDPDLGLYCASSDVCLRTGAGCAVI